MVKYDGDRAFMVKYKDGHKEMWLAAQAVDGLRKFNKKNIAKQDLNFLMALIVGLCSVKNITEHPKIEEGILDLAKGEKILFNYV